MKTKQLTGSITEPNMPMSDYKHTTLGLLKSMKSFTLLIDAFLWINLGSLSCGNTIKFKS